MIYEKPGLLVEEGAYARLDDELASGFLDLHKENKPTYKMLTPPADVKAATKLEFVDGTSPDLTMRTIDAAQLATREAELKAWKRSMLEVPGVDPDIKQAYRWRINEDIAGIHILQASNRGDMRSFKRWNEFIYGKPDAEIYRAAVDWIAGEAELILAGVGEESPLAEAARVVLDKLGPDRGEASLIAPPDAAFEAVREDHAKEGGYFALLLAGVEVPETPKIDQAVGGPILEHVVRNNLESDYDLRPVSGTVWGLSHEDGGAVEHPETYNMPRQRFIGLGLGHEIGSHLLERVNAERGPLGIAVEGLDRYEAGNEGRAVIREQVAYDTFDEFGKLVRWRDILRRHIAISYGAGTRETPEHSAAEVYELMNAIDYMYQLKLRPDDPEVAASKAQAKTVALLQRVLKGTDGTGGAYLKDKVYLEGNVAYWRAVQEHGPDIISHGDLGKFDLTNPRHIVLMQKFGLLPEAE